MVLLDCKGRPCHKLLLLCLLMWSGFLQQAASLHGGESVINVGQVTAITAAAITIYKWSLMKS